MKNLKSFTNFFSEYKLEYDTPKGIDTILNNRLTSILKYIRNNNLSKYTLFGFKNNQWEIIIKR